MKNYILIIFCLAAFCRDSYCQQTGKVKSFSINNKTVITADGQYNLLDPMLQNRVLPKPNPGVDRAVVKNVKDQLKSYRSNRNQLQNNKTSAVADPLTLVRNFAGNAFNYFVPNDNDMAISNHDEVCSVTNTTIWSRDQVNNVTYGSFNLHTITSSLGLPQEEFDPKVVYDPLADRFIVVCLNGFTDTTSNVIVGFSQDSTSHGAWNFYSLPGNPLNNNLWTDFPMLTVTNGELFITCNLLYNDSTWQAGFNETVIWQINKSEGYNGSVLNPLLHYDIMNNNEPLRNLCPVKGGSMPQGPNCYFLSNRNFAVTNDTIFLVEVPSMISVPPVPVTVTPAVSTLPYRMPADAEQSSADMLIVNDARILGAFHENSRIQFVFNTLDLVSGYDGIYHGTIDLSSLPLLVNAALYVNDTMDLAYPNIAYGGLSNSDNRAVISVLHSSATTFPGCSAFQFDGTGNYSDLTIVKAGAGYTNMLTGDERWGDYTGCQTRYNMPGFVWMSGSYTIVSHTTRTWIGELATVNTSVAEIPAVSEMDVYPNPTSDRLNIDFDKKEDGFIEISITDIQSKKTTIIYRGQISKGPNTFSINTNAIAKGSYIIQISDNKVSGIAVRKFIRE
jgi:hypothetical protein